MAAVIIATTMLMNNGGGYGGYDPGDGDWLFILVMVLFALLMLVGTLMMFA